jgi:hypothetical protein
MIALKMRLARTHNPRNEANNHWTVSNTWITIAKSLMTATSVTSQTIPTAKMIGVHHEQLRDCR